MAASHNARSGSACIAGLVPKSHDQVLILPLTQIKGTEKPRAQFRSVGSRLCTNEARPGAGEREVLDMTPEIFERVKRDRRFQELVARRTRFAWTLSGVMLAIYFGFIFIIAFVPKTLGVSLGSGVTTVGIPVGLFVIVSAFALTGIYVRRANSEFDEITRAIIEEAK